MRLFIAVNFDQETKNKMIEVQGRLRELDRSANFTRAENLHLTLAFLGEMPAERVSAVRNAMDQTQFEPTELSFDHIGCFERNGRDTWWIGTQQNHILECMQNALTANLAAQDFQIESRTFKPHITLAREIMLPEKPDQSILLKQSFSAQLNGIHLMQSHRKDGKLIYTSLYEKQSN